MTRQQQHTDFSLPLIFLSSISAVLLSLTGCGTSSYGEAVTKSKPELELRSKFALLGPDYFKFPVEADPRTKKSIEYPIAFRVPRIFLDDDPAPQPQWKTFGGKAVKLGSRDPFELKLNPDHKGAIQQPYAMPPEFMEPSFVQAHQGTFIAEYRIKLEDPPGSSNMNTFQQNLMMSIWVFDTANKSRPVPSDTFVLQGVKRAGKEPAALASINAAQKKAEKAAFKTANAWEDDEIPTAPTPDKLKGSISAKLARIFVKSRFLHAHSEQARMPVERDGVVRLWSFRIGENNRYQVFLMLRLPIDLTTGDDAPFPLDAENPESDKLVDLGRAVIGSMVVIPESTPAATEEKKK